ncbi:MAG TPA: urea carboxylase [Polyangia bacterium]|nr:urea carboxylase [Polyangia bacterium]
MFHKVLIANRGAIACRIQRTLRKMGVASVAVFSDADAHAPHVRDADQAVRLGPAPPAESYLRGERIIEIARQTGAEAIHPGYGFLSENADFAEQIERAGLAFLGPTPKQMRDFGLKHTARALAAQSGLPLLPGTGLVASAGEALVEAARIGYPVMLKSTGGGGGIGMRRCASADELGAAYEAVARLARSNFKDAGLFLEKLVSPARHVEVQIFGDGAGKIVALGDRDCSLQRRNQKVIEETPAPGLSEATRQALFAAAVAIGQSARYRSAGTVEFILDPATQAFYFLEVNTRIQVEHGITEEVTGVDLVEWMVRLGAGEALDLDRPRPTRGASIEARLYAEDPARGFQPSCGLVSHIVFGTARVETWVEPGTEVTPHYDPMVAKVIATGADRGEAIDRLSRALSDSRVDGIETNRAHLVETLALPAFRAGQVHTALLDEVQYAPAAFEVVEPGTQTTVQDHPGRRGYWDVGVPPSGPMDALSFRLGNQLLGNAPDSAGLECTAVGPTLRFRRAVVVALTGADMGATLDGKPVPRFAPISIVAGGVLKLGAVQGPGNRAYLCVRGGIDVPPYLGSRATFTLGLFGGHAGRALRAGDVLHFDDKAATLPMQASLPAALVPRLTREWEIAVLHGPHGAPDFFTAEGIEAFFAASWTVHYNSSRTGVRLVGPKPLWARQDGGEAGLHPSNIHDNAYAVGTIDFTGDMPVILGPDGPSLGGFVCPVTIVEAELWKVGQLKAGDTVRFRAIPLDEARQLAHRQAAEIATVVPAPGPRTIARTEPPSASPTAVLRRLPETAERPSVTVRQDGDANLLVEYGPMVLDLALRFRVHALSEWFARRRLPGIIDLTPGIRSLHLHYDDARLPRERLLDELAQAEDELPRTDEIAVPSRIVHLPLSWDDPATRLAIQKYTTSVRPDAPWCPSNIEFIRRINGLDSIDEVKRIVFEASYLVLGLGDVYLGAPVATPIDPRHRLVTTKYNPARTWTPENAVGIGGAYLCIYGMEGPGGYQFVGRTCQMWNRIRQTEDFVDGKPWLLRFFDQVRFYPVSADELLAFREDFPRGRVKLKVEESSFKLGDYTAFLRANEPSIAAFKQRQQAAFEEERERWKALPEVVEPVAAPVEESDEPALGPGETAVRAEVTGSVWQVAVDPGQRVKAGDRLVVLETMKMETPVAAPVDGVVKKVLVRSGALVRVGQLVAVLATG